MTIALFLGRFQPPHVGHLLTIKNLLREYDKLIIGVTEGLPRIMAPDVVKAMLADLIDNDRVDVVLINGVVEDGTAIIDFDFDVCVSGNQRVLEIMRKRGKSVSYAKRSLDNLYTGTSQRQKFMQETQKRDERPLYSFRLMPIEHLRPIEKINRSHFNQLESQILSEGVIKKPLIIDEVTGAVLDGSHRYAFFYKHGYTEAPVWACRYDDESISVGNHLTHRWKYSTERWIDKNHVRATAISQKLYPPRTTRHFFPFIKGDINLHLSTLSRKELGRGIAHLLSETNKMEEIAMNIDYIDELEKEIEVLKNYLKEQHEVKIWLELQNSKIVNE